MTQFLCRGGFGRRSKEATPENGDGGGSGAVKRENGDGGKVDAVNDGVNGHIVPESVNVNPAFGEWGNPLDENEVQAAINLAGSPT